MYAEIEQIIREVLDIEVGEMYSVTISEVDGEIGLHMVFPIDLLRDLLMDYYYHKADYAAICNSIVKNCHLNPLDAIELIGAVDDLREKPKNDLQ